MEFVFLACALAVCGALGYLLCRCNAPRGSYLTGIGISGMFTPIYVMLAILPGIFL